MRSSHQTADSSGDRVAPAMPFLRCPVLSWQQTTCRLERDLNVMGQGVSSTGWSFHARPSSLTVYSFAFRLRSDRPTTRPRPDRAGYSPRLSSRTYGSSRVCCDWLPRAGFAPPLYMPRRPRYFPFCARLDPVQGSTIVPLVHDLSALPGFQVL